MKEIAVSVLTKEKFLVVDSGISISEWVENQLRFIMEMNALSFNDFKYEFISASNEGVLHKINESKNILVSTTFSNIKNNAVEDLINAGIQHNLKDKNIFSLMPFDIVGGDFKYYEDEVGQLAKNNVLFYFLSRDAKSFETLS